MPSILFIAAHRPNRSPGQRFRFEQYFDYLKENGWKVELSYIISKEDDRILYSPGNYISKLIILIKSIKQRFNDLKKAKKVDVVFIQREALMVGTTYFEKRFAKISKIIFDFDDSIWISDENPKQGILNKLKRPSKTEEIISYSEMVFAGNQYLANYASKFNRNIRIIPTTIDTAIYIPDQIKSNAKICIGWSGSFSTIKHFEKAIVPLIRIKEKYKEKVFFKVIGDPNYHNEELEITGQAWRAETEVKDLNEFDIGIMPLPDDAWSRGKCGLKGLQYMALEIPTIMSPVGVNNLIIENGKNGFLANTENEWIEKLSLLIESKELRKQIGKEGRKTVEKRFSVEANKEKYLQAFNELIKR